MTSSDRTGRRRRTAVGAVLFVALGAALAGLLAGCAGSAPTHHTSSAPLRASHAATSARTAIDTFTAYDRTGRLHGTVSARRDGQCFSTSIAAAGSRALRCMAANQILDPCFADPAPSRTVACFAAPWAPAVVLHLTAAPPAPPAARDPRVWAFAVRGGARCVASTGTVAAVGTTALPYHCTDGTDAALGGLTAKPVVARVGAPGATALRTETVEHVWRV